MEEDIVLGLIKIGAAKYQQSLYDKGEIFMQTQDYFRKLEDREGRGDKYEGAHKIEQVQWLKISDGTRKFEFSIKEGSLKDANVFSRYSESNCNIYSMIGISVADMDKQLPIPESNRQLGDYFILIYNVKEFIRRVKSKLESLSYDYSWGWVHYYEEYEYEGDLSLYHKPKIFQSQKEVRFIVYANRNEPLKFEIGSLSDIALPFNIDELKTFKIIDKNTFEIGTKKTP